MTAGSGEGFPQAHGPCHTASYLGSSNGTDWVTPPGVTNPVVSDLKMIDGDTSVIDNESMDPLYYQGDYFILYDALNIADYNSGDCYRFAISKSTGGIAGPYTWVTDVQIFDPVVSTSTCADARWFIDDNGDVYVIMACS